MARRTGGRPGCESSFQRATKTDQEASGLVVPSATRSLREALAGRGRGMSGFVVSFVASRRRVLDLRICCRRVAVYVSWVY